MGIGATIGISIGILFGSAIIMAFIMGFIKLVFPDFPYFWKYKIRKKTPKEEDIEFLVSLIEKEKSRENVIKEALLTNIYSIKRAKELSFLFLEVEKSLKGGKEE